jgi:hydrogenase expression/formation protein HypD
MGMKYLDEYRDPELARGLLLRIREKVTQPWVIMEVCGGHTHAIMKYGIDQMLTGGIELVHGPGCPVCVTPVEMIDKAVCIAARQDVIFACFGDMLRVPGSIKSLAAVKATGGDVRIVYSPLEAVRVARENPEREVVFFAVGFETTAPGNVMAVEQALHEGLNNFSVLMSHMLIPPAMEILLASPENRVQGYLAAGHVCTVSGCRPYERIAARFGVPVVPTGFEPTDILAGILMVVTQLEEGRSMVENQYSRSVRAEGNRAAQEMVERVCRIVDRKWRGLGELPASGLALRPEYATFDAALRFAVDTLSTDESTVCISGAILQGLKKPTDCPAFGGVCSPSKPLGATMVSTEGACSAYYRYRSMRVC